MMRFNIGHIRLISSIKEQKFDDAAEHLLEVLNEMNDHREQIHIHQTQVTEEIKKMKQEISDLKEAFPGNDPRGHKAYHEKVMREQVNSEMLKQQIMKDIIQKGILVLTGILLTTMGMKFGVNLLGI